MRKVLLAALVAALSNQAHASNLIYIGDSQSAEPGTLLSKLKPSLEAHNSIVGGDAVCGASITDHLNGASGGCRYHGVQHMNVSGGKVEFQPGSGHVTPLASLMNGSNADTVIVELGDNNLGDAKAGSKAAKLIATILESGRNCVWITPAAVTGRSPKCQGVNLQKKAASAAIEKAAKDTVVNGKTCHVVNSYTLTKNNPPRSIDTELCVHYPQHYDAWANAIRPAVLRAIESGNGNGRTSVQPSADSAVK